LNKIGDLYSLYGNTAVTPELKDTTKEEEDLFGDMQGPTQQEVNNHLEEIGTPSKKLLTALYITPNLDAHIDHNNIEEPDNNQEEGFDDFEEAGYEEPKQSQSNYPEVATPTEDFHAKNTNLFTDPFENPTTPANYAEEESQEEGFGDFEDASPALDIRVEPTQDIILQEKETIPVNNEDEDGFDDFEDAGHEVKQGKDGTPVKSLSHLGASMLPQETSDFGSLAEVQVGQHEEHKAKDIGSIKEEEIKGDGNDDFGSFNEVEVEKGKRENVFDQKDESIFNAVESSDDSPIKEKDKNPFTEDEFGDFVRSKQDVTQEKMEGSSVNETEEEKYDVESVLAEFGVSTNDSEEVEEKGEDLTEEIEKRIEEITEEYERNLFESSLMRNSLAKSKFKVNSEMIEDLVKELKSLQKYKEALMTQGQIKVREGYYRE